MARVTFVKKAQQRYETVPVLDEGGQPKRTPVMLSNGQQKQSKRGPVFMTVTVEDKSKPLPNYTYETCHVEIKPGMPYKHVSPKSGPYGGRKRTRCITCPTWQPWDLSNSLSARIAQITYELDSAMQDATCADDVASAHTDAASSVRELAEEKREAAENIESGFGHETEMSSELSQQADDLEQWADELDDYSVDEPEIQEEDCDECSGTGEIGVDCDTCGGSGEVKCDAGEHECSDCEGSGSRKEECSECDGSGSVTPDEPSEDTLDEWRNNAIDQSPIQNCPV